MPCTGAARFTPYQRRPGLGGDGLACGKARACAGKNLATLAPAHTTAHRERFRETGPTAPLSEVVDARSTQYLRLPSSQHPYR